MLYNAKNAVLQIGDGEMDYIRFGTGEKKLIMLPGLGDGLQTVKGTVLPMALMYRLCVACRKGQISFARFANPIIACYNSNTDKFREQYHEKADHFPSGGAAVRCLRTR